MPSLKTQHSHAKLPYENSAITKNESLPVTIFFFFFFWKCCFNIKTSYWCLLAYQPSKRLFVSTGVLIQRVFSFWVSLIYLLLNFVCFHFSSKSSNSGLNNPDKLKGRNDIENFFQKKKKTEIKPSRACLAYKAIWSYCTLIQIKVSKPMSISIQ